jgi:hypothetical protein
MALGYTPAVRSWSNWNGWIPPRHAGLAGLLCVAFVAALAVPVHRRAIGTYWTETDFYHWYAPDADRLLAGRFPGHNTSNPPGYPALLALLHPVTGDHFVTGRWLSLFAAGATGLAGFALFRRVFGPGAALLGCAIVLLSGEYTRYAIQATTDTVFLLLVAIVLLVVTGGRWSGWRWAAALGAASGLAYLVRYNGLFLVVPCLAAILAGPGSRRSRAGQAAAYLLAWLIVTSPWLAANWSHHGSPFYSTNHHDIAWHVLRQRDYASLADVALRHPAAFVSGYLVRVIEVVGRYAGASLWVLPVGALAALGAVARLRRPGARGAALLLVALGAHVALMSLTHWEARYHFPAMLVLSGFAAYLVCALGTWLRTRVPGPAAAAAVAALIALILVPSVWRGTLRVSGVLHREAREVLPASEFLRRLDPTGSALLSPHPHLAYLSGRPWRRLPDLESLEQLQAFVRRSDAGYVAWDRAGPRISPRLRGALAEPARVAEWLEPVYRDDAGGLVIYRVRS